jgi:ABC-type lipoprotein export system ATPase subunit
MIRLSNVNKYFFKGKQNEIHVINDISLELPQKGMVALFGQSGCGKTTLLNVIGGLDGIKSGSIEIDGKDIRKNTDDLRNRYIGYIFQNYNLNLKVTNYENVAESLRLCGMEDEETISERVYAALANVGMEKFANRMPDTLSGGQKQRIAIARAIVKNPAIILADEPTGNLDEANTIVIMDLLKSISKEHLVLLVTHENELVDYYCDQVIGLKDGKVTEIRENKDANGYVGRDNTVVYLGD